MEMTQRTRKRFFMSGEGVSEQPFMKLLQYHSDLKELFVHLDYKPLNGGGYRSMLESAIKARQQGLKRGVYHNSFLIVDTDRADRKDCFGDYTLEELKLEAAKHKFQVCALKPNYEGLLLRMLSENHNLLSPQQTLDRLKRYWPDYKKPVDFHTLFRKLTLDHLLSLESVDQDLKNLLKTIGLISF